MNIDDYVKIETETNPGMIERLLQEHDPNRRPGPYLVTRQTMYWTAEMLADWLGTLPEELVSGQTAAVVTDATGFAQALIPVDEDDPASAADLVADVLALNAAPELLEALISLAAAARRYLPNYDEHPEVQKADAAIAKAKGGKP